ncbi:hypothetical protein SAMN05216570_1618 [Dyella sp. OK004]|uniref:hypothetical protein n=1 Tax=Dyella sp. OK004 TaxID=1855292 RepID=UPI0008E8DACB|nr:hypothetical protein [Dyella sp. OK004]SFS02371.1 hypothetical protein SAMN05216570_1618 [Dyella sp. OK004]
MFKQVLTMGAMALVLCACGSQKTRETVPLDALVVPASAPWISVEPSQGDLLVRGLDQKVILTPSRPVSDVLQAQLRQALQPAYISNLTVTCERVKTDMRVKHEDDAPSTATLDISMRCTTNARGFVTRSELRSQPSAPVSTQTDYAKLFVVLLDGVSKEMAGKVQADIDTSKSNLK